VAAVGSFLEARRQGGEWLVRIEDLDFPRIVPGMADEHLRTLEIFGFTWDGPVLRQSARLAHYLAALEALRAADLVYECSCTRSSIARDLAATDDADAAYPGTCRQGPTRAGERTATRLRVHRLATAPVAFTDLFQGPFVQDVAREVGDFILRRRDGFIAYQLAVVIDDAAQGITDVVRGADLLDNTPRQRLLQDALELPAPRYGHLPVVTEPDGRKLAKSQRAVPLDPARAPELLRQALALLQHQAPDTLRDAPVKDLWSWARTHWDPARLKGCPTVAAP
jgi:glutamyl-Q tRNA(Asp) synthetase